MMTPDEVAQSYKWMACRCASHTMQVVEDGQAWHMCWCPCAEGAALRVIMHSQPLHDFAACVEQGNQHTAHRQGQGLHVCQPGMQPGSWQ
jgi:hypothetical protein